MQTIFALVVCAVANNQVLWDRCMQAPGSYGFFTAADQCWAARSDWALSFARIPRAQSAAHKFIQWHDQPNDPFNTTVTCVQKDVPAFRPAP